MLVLGIDLHRSQRFVTWELQFEGSTSTMFFLCETLPENGKYQVFLVRAA